MKEFQGSLDQESIQALSSLLHKNIQTIYSCNSAIEYGSSIITVNTLSIPIGKKFLIVNNDWADTPSEGVDYYFLSVRLSNKPHQIFYDPNPGPNQGHFKPDHLSLNLGPLLPVIKIEIFSYSEVGSEECVKYDAGLMLTRSDGRRIAIIREKSITGFLQIAHTEENIMKITKGLNVRVIF